MRRFPSLSIKNCIFFQTSRILHHYHQTGDRILILLSYSPAYYQNHQEGCAQELLEKFKKIGQSGKQVGLNIYYAGENSEPRPQGGFARGRGTSYLKEHNIAIEKITLANIEKAFKPMRTILDNYDTFINCYKTCLGLAEDWTWLQQNNGEVLKGHQSAFSNIENDLKRIMWG